MFEVPAARYGGSLIGPLVSKPAVREGHVWVIHINDGALGYADL